MAEPSPDTIRRAQAGDRDSFAELIEGQQRYVYSIALSLTKDPTDAADVTQDAFLRLYRSLGTYRFETKFTTWLYRLVVNLALDHLRRNGRNVVRLDQDPGLDIESTDDETDAPLVAERHEQAVLVRAALDELPDAQRLALTLHYFQDMRYEDIAVVMGVPMNTVRSHIHRGKQRLARTLDPVIRRTTAAGKA